MKTIWIILLSACAGALLTMMLTRSCQVEPPLPEMQILRDTITEVYIDTFTAYKPQPYKVEVKDTIYIEKEYSGHVFVQETKWFGDNETYDMQVSGINVQLDYINTFPKTVTQYITTTERVYIQPQKWSVWASGGVGIKNNKPTMPIEAKLKYTENRLREYYMKAGTDIINGSTYIIGGMDVKLF